MPDSYFVDMQRIDSVQEVYDLEEKPKFKTRADYKKSWEITRQDIQYCTYENTIETTYYNQYITSVVYNEPKTVEWGQRQYDREWPPVPAKCYLKNITSIELNYWIKKYDIFITWPYYYWYKF